MITSLQLAEKFVGECEARSLNLCHGYGDWTHTALALATLGEPARELFHRLARMDADYRHGENERKFTDALRSTSRRKGSHIGLGSLMHRASLQGVELGRLGRSASTRRLARPKPMPTADTDFIPIDIIDNSADLHNNLCRFLAETFGTEAAAKAAENYRIGSMRHGQTIFPQIDMQGRCRTAKIIQYDPDCGHRLRSSKAAWLHTRFGSEFKLRQCLFGEHLLAKRPTTAPVAIVEAEKTALICSIVFPRMTWLATGGMQGLAEARLAALKDFRNVVVYPDADAAVEWHKTIAELPFARDWKISQWWLDEADDSHNDIADLLLAEVSTSVL